MKFLLTIIGFLGGISAENYNKDCTCILGFQKTEKYSNQNVAEAFEKFSIVKDYLPVAPDGFLKAPFRYADVVLGTFIPPLRVIDLDYFKWAGAKPDANYTMVTIDIDAPSFKPREEKGFFNFFFVNIPGSNIGMDSGDMIIPFSPAMPTPGSGLHRIIALVYEQTSYINPDDPAIISLSRKRLIPKIEEITTKYNLGNPVAGNFFTTELIDCDSAN